MLWVILSFFHCNYACWELAECIAVQRGEVIVMTLQKTLLIQQLVFVSDILLIVWQSLSHRKLIHKTHSATQASMAHTLWLYK